MKNLGWFILGAGVLIYLFGKVKISSKYSPNLFTVVPLREIGIAKGKDVSFLSQQINVKLLFR